MGKRAVCTLMIFTVLALWPGAARSTSASTPRTKHSISLYQKGAQLYAQGDLRGALAAYRDLLQASPGNRTALLSIARIEMELTNQRQAPRAAPHPESSGFDDFILNDLAQWVQFDRSLGDAQDKLGTMAARNGELKQLLAERRVAFNEDRKFLKERELRALVRRLSTD